MSDMLNNWTDTVQMKKKRYIAINENEIKTHISRYRFFDHDWVTRECREQNRLFGNRTEPWPHPHTTDQLTNRHSTTLFVMPFLKMIGDKWFFFFSESSMKKLQRICLRPQGRARRADVRPVRHADAAMHAVREINVGRREGRDFFFFEFERDVIGGAFPFLHPSPSRKLETG